MEPISRPIRCLLALLLVGFVAAGRAQPLVMAEFVGTSPCDTLPREFVGGIPVTAPCHCITWELTFFTNQSARMPATYKLVASYGLPGRNDPNQIEDGPRVEQQGTWKMLKGMKTNSRALVYRITADKSESSLSFVKVGENLLHFLNPDTTLMIGNAGWSYTLNKRGVGMDN
jgi:hypothetical protein